jgi:hypothetical protein
MSFNITDGTDHVTEMSDEQLQTERNQIEANVRVDQVGGAPTAISIRNQLERRHADEAALTTEGYVTFAQAATFVLVKVFDQLAGDHEEVAARYATVVGELLVRMRESG